MLEYAVMVCEKCGREASTVHVTYVEGGDPHERHLCKNCAGEPSPRPLLRCDRCGRSLGLRDLLASPRLQELLKTSSPSPGCKDLGAFLAGMRMGCPDCGAPLSLSTVPPAETSRSFMEWLRRLGA
jgi:protein-arginine kinase activator protein McsA